MAGEQLRVIEGSEQDRLGVLDVTVARNAFGRQVDSFEAEVPVPAVGAEPVRGVFHYLSGGATITVPLLNRNQGSVAAAATTAGSSCTTGMYASASIMALQRFSNARGDRSGASLTRTVQTARR